MRAENKAAVHLVAGGPPELLPDLSRYAGDPAIFWIGIDRGVRYLLHFRIRPDLAIGDFDSLRPLGELPVETEILSFPAEKDETDMELALRHALGMNPGIIRIFGATGGRLDHFIANLHLMAKITAAHPEIPLRMFDIHNILEVKTPGTYELPEDPLFPYVSFIPLTSSVENLTLKGFKYPLDSRHISFGSTLCISNELAGPAGTYSFAGGILLVVRSADAPDGERSGRKRGDADESTLFEPRRDFG